MGKLGRRGSGADTRGSLLKASCELILENGIGTVSLRDISDRANVNQAMVRYHFSNKEGLMKATLDHGFEQLLAQLPKKEEFEPTIKSIIGWIRKNPWLVSLMMKSVYGGDELRKHFETVHTPKLLGLFDRILKQGQANAQVRQGLDQKFLVSSLVSLIIFPILAAPVMDKTLNTGPQKKNQENYLAELMRLLGPNGDKT